MQAILSHHPENLSDLKYYREWDMLLKSALVFGCP